MLWFNNKQIFPVGVDMTDNAVKLVQLRKKGKSTELVYGSSKNRPSYIQPGSGDWQRWAIDALKEMLGNGKFKSREVIAAMPAAEVFVDVVKEPKNGHKNPEEIIMSRLKQKMPFSPEEAIIKFQPAEEGNILVLATERQKVDRHLAIYERANLKIKSMCVWPAALANTYTCFFGRRQSDFEAVVLLIDIEPDCTNVVISRHSKLLYANSIPVGTDSLNDEASVNRLVFELNGCKRQYVNSYQKNQIERLVFLSGQAVDKQIYTVIAKQMELPAQLGDCLAAVDIQDPITSGIERRQCQFSWAAAFGLSLS